MMKINPIFKKDMISSMRNSRTAVVITLFNLCFGTIILLYIYEKIHLKQYEKILDYQDINKLAVLSGGIILCFTLLYVPFVAAKTVIIERQKQNLDLILLAVSSPIYFVWEKLMAVISVYVMILISSLPVVAVIFSTGGSNVFVYVKMFFQFLSTALLAGSIGLFFSCIAKRKMTSIFWSYATIIIFCALPFLVYHVFGLDIWQHTLKNGTRHPKSIFLGNPAVTFYYFISPEHASSLSLYQGIHFLWDWSVQSILVQISISVIFTVVSAFRLKPSVLTRKKK